MQILSPGDGRVRYAPLHGSTGSVQPRNPLSPPRNPRSSPCRIFVALSTLVLVAVVSFSAGRRYPYDTELEYEPQLRTVKKTFKYNLTFALPPSEETDRAWHDLFPEQGGFFKHPGIAPERSAISSFHQLHCLDNLRQGYWTLYDIANSDAKFNESELPFMASPSHVRHCIDLLRQALMCQPDLSIELKNETLGGVTGFGTEHRCRDWDQLLRWMTEWETYGQENGAVRKEGDHHGHSGPSH